MFLPYKPYILRKKSGVKRTEYFFGRASSNDAWDPKKAMDDAIIKRNEFLEKNKDSIEEVISETIQVNPASPTFNQFYCILSLSYFSK